MLDLFNSTSAVIFASAIFIFIALKSIEDLMRRAEKQRIAMREDLDRIASKIDGLPGRLRGWDDT